MRKKSTAREHRLPLLEVFDFELVSRRVGDQRTVARVRCLDVVQPVPLALRDCWLGIGHRFSSRQLLGKARLNKTPPGRASMPECLRLKEPGPKNVGTDIVNFSIPVKSSMLAIILKTGWVKLWHERSLGQHKSLCLRNYLRLRACSISATRAPILRPSLIA